MFIFFFVRFLVLHCEFGELGTLIAGILHALGSGIGVSFSCGIGASFSKSLELRSYGLRLLLGFVI